MHCDKYMVFVYNNNIIVFIHYYQLIIIFIFIHGYIFTHYQTYSLDRMALELALIRVKCNLP